MRLAVYNILNGGEGRADPLAEVLLACRPDLVALVEADDPTVLERLSARLHMDHVRAMGRKRSAALLSRWPIVETINHGALRSGGPQSFLEALVAGPDGTQWRLGIVHLHPRPDDQSERAREGEVEVVLETFARHRQSDVPHVLCGDFNAVSPVQEIDPRRLRAPVRAVFDEGGDLPRRAVQRLLEGGYIDTFHSVHGRSGPEDVSFTTHEPGLRVDYVFTWGYAAERITDAWIEQDRLAKYASDHFPVGAEVSEPAG